MLLQFTHLTLYYYQLPQLPDTILVIHINISGQTKTRISINFILIQWNLLPIHIHEAATVDAFKALIPVTVLTFTTFKRSPYNMYIVLHLH